jgi:hypothetical protein
MNIQLNNRKELIEQLMNEKRNLYERLTSK